MTRRRHDPAAWLEEAEDALADGVRLLRARIEADGEATPLETAKAIEILARAITVFRATVVLQDGSEQPRRGRRKARSGPDDDR